MRHVITHFRMALTRALDHDVFNTAKAAAYSGMLCFFPAVLVLTTLLASVEAGPSIIGVMRGTFDQVLPPESTALLQNSLDAQPMRSTQVVFSASVLAVFAGLGVMLSLMEGFRRAYELPRGNWGFWEKRLRALMLVPIALLPLWLASLLLVFGHQIEVWMIANSDHELRHVVIVFWRMVRWVVAVATTVTVLSALYHFGTRRTEHWARVLPGAIASTAIWFPATLAFGWYVTRVADYTRFYGSFAAGIATLVWLYLTSFSALVGAELNGVLFHGRQERQAPATTPAAETDASAALTSL
jgi:membrane protein